MKSTVCLPPHSLEPQELIDADFETLVRRSWQFEMEEIALRSLPDDILTAVVATRTAMEFLRGRSRQFYLSDDPRHPRKTTKADGSATVPEDREAQAIVAAIIRKRFPHDGLFGEEDLREGAQNGRVWIIDGLDGTEQFYRGRNNYASAVSLTENGKPILGAVAWYIWNRISVFFAKRGHGAYDYTAGDDDMWRSISCFDPLTVNRPRPNEPERIASHRRLVKAFLEGRRSPAGEFFGRLDRETREGKEFTFILNHWEYIHPPEERDRLERLIAERAQLDTLGSSAIEQGFVASGAYHGYVSALVKPWDAAGTVIIEEAGGRVTDWRGQPRDIFSETGMIATNGGPIHDQLVAILKDSPGADPAA
jgi:myo-inositol-1(or 4)-monophosphatase